jgi:hypothetical protein
MTREQAIDLMARVIFEERVEYFPQAVARATPMVDAFIALGMLKVEEPGTAIVKTERESK